MKISTYAAAALISVTLLAQNRVPPEPPKPRPAPAAPRNTAADWRQEIAAEVQKMKQDLRIELMQNLKQELRSELAAELRQELRSELRAELMSEIRAEVRSAVRQ